MLNYQMPVWLKTGRQTASRLLGALLICCCGAYGLPPEQTKKIDNLISTLYQRGQFNGAILVAEQGKAIYRKAFGKANFQTGSDFHPETPSNIGSVTKQFTAIAIMILAERNKLSYGDSMSKYVPEFLHSAQISKITLRHLLTHSSGIPDYGDLGIDDSDLDQQGLIKAILKSEHLLSRPGLNYRYSNPGYALLAVVVERVSDKQFGEFLEQEVFHPLGMSNTFVYDRPKKKNANAAVGYDQFGQTDDGGPTAIPGDGGIYSTVDDLFRWDQGLYTDALVRQSTLAEAFTPGKVEEGASTYGFGWNVTEQGGHKYLWHQGNQAGFRAFIERRPTERSTVIMLTNKGNSKRMAINAAIHNILAASSYVLPRQSGAEKLYKTIHDSGIQAAMKMYDGLKNDKNTDYDFGEAELNTLGYQLLYGDKRPGDAIAIFELNTAEHPASSNAFDSLGEAYSRNGEKARAINSYQTAVRLDPTNGHAAAVQKQLKLNVRNWVAEVVTALIVLALIGFGRKWHQQRKRNFAAHTLE